jgi:hypothetical protein
MPSSGWEASSSPLATSKREATALPRRRSIPAGGSDIHDIYLLLVNTSWKADDYKVTVVVTEKQ